MNHSGLTKEQMGRPESLSEIREGVPLKNAVILVSAKTPGCGSTTIAQGLATALSREYPETQLRLVGKQLRAELGVTSDSDMVRSLGNVPDPSRYDAQFYTNLPGEPVVIEGKLATLVGPRLIHEQKNDRPILAIELFAPALTSAMRVMRREGQGLEKIIRRPEMLLSQAEAIEARTKHIREKLRPVGSGENAIPVETVAFDTSLYHSQEILGWLLGRKDWEHEAPAWEIEALTGVVQTLFELSLDTAIDARERVHFQENFDAVQYNLLRLKTTLNSAGLVEIRDTLRKQITHAVFALLLKRIPRFLVNREGQVRVDMESQKWTPEYYKIMMAWPTLKEYLRDQVILDPFAGAGTFVNVLSARGIPKRVYYGDLAYRGGRPLNGQGEYYDPRLNTAMIQGVFDGLPSWYKPECLSRSGGFATLDVQRLPLPEASVDYVVGDPPYGINLPEGGHDFFFATLPEMLRVSRKGGIFLIPESWTAQLVEKGIPFQKLTRDLSNGSSNIPTCFVHVFKIQMGS